MEKAWHMNADDSCPHCERQSNATVRERPECHWHGKPSQLKHAKGPKPNSNAILPILQSPPLDCFDIEG